MRHVDPSSAFSRHRRLLPGAGVAVLCAFLFGGSASAGPERALHGSVSVSKQGNGSGHVGSSPGGIDCGGACAASFKSKGDPGYSPVSLGATPDPGSTFGGWGGACSGTGGCTIEIVGAGGYGVTATFDLAPPPEYSLAVSLSGSGAVTSTPAGIDCGKKCSAPFKAGDTVTLAAAPTPGWSFGGWSGHCSGADQCVLAMNEPKSVTATFIPPETSYAVGVSVSEGGQVTSDLPGIECGAACLGSFGAGVTVKLTASGDGLAWSGACSGSDPVCTLSMDGPKAASAAFGGGSPASFPVVVAARGKGTVASDAGGIDCGAACATRYAAGTAATLVTTPADGWRFAGWSGACTGVARTCRVTASAPVAAVATFVEEGTRFPLALTTAGRGTVRSVPPGVSCSRACSGAFLAGSLVRLAAAPAEKFEFARWGGACEGTEPACLVPMDGPKSVSATFVRRADLSPPRVRALPSSGVSGQTVRLRYRVRDDSGQSRETARVYRGARKLVTVRGSLDDADPDALFYFLAWKVSASLLPGTLRFCVWAEDGSGNRSRPSCAPLRITGARP